MADLRQLMTLRQHYYPEGGWGWLLVVVTFMVQSISHGLHMSLGVLIPEIVAEFGQNFLCAGTLYLTKQRQKKMNLIFFKS